ncbi:MAG TPA: PQQ-dependent sugar dehydrogenase [Thermoanaerobaculia bacterium]|nr:PQQ-dependent sugar dehydrogenase [Thermoanaerobaculia bacterium]
MNEPRGRIPFAASAVATLALALGPLALAPARAATACKTQTCGSCSGTPTPHISILVPSNAFPASGGTPTAFVDPSDGTNRRLIATQQGTILVWDGGSQTILPTPFLDLRDDVGGPVLAGGERGLLSLAVDPDYAQTGHLYVFYTAATAGPGDQGDVVIERYTRSAGNPDVGDPASALTILVIDHPASNHNGGTLAFGPDGFLYISTGDGGGSCDGGAGANGDGQRPDTLAGKMLRLDVRGVDPGAGSPDDCGNTPGNYTVPSTNPFFGQEPACDEVWALGLRNPFRFSFDRATGDLWIGDVGQNKWEEINLQRAVTPAPVNWGWVCREGCETGGNDESLCSTAGCPVDPGNVCEFPRATSFWDPVLCHYNGGWKSIMGGFRYRGSLVSGIDGDYFYSDAYCGQIWKTTTLDPANPAAIDAECWASGFGGTYGFAEDHLGELYVVQGGAGRIDCIHDGAGCYWAGWGGLFEDGFESGDTSRWSSATP